MKKSGGGKAANERKTLSRRGTGGFLVALVERPTAGAA
jgi:hypothetical protein